MAKKGLLKILPHKEICEKYINGKNSNEIAKEYNTTGETIRRVEKYQLDTSRFISCFKKRTY